MIGRDPAEIHRVSTPLELLFDLTFVVAFGTAASELVHGVVGGHLGPALGGFCFAVFAVSWAWINFTWFASAYDTDDWLHRLTTMFQMGGALIFALGLPAMFASLYRGEALDIRVMVLGYVVMRVALISQWWRASRHDPGRRRSHFTYIVSIGASQILWCVLAALQLPIGPAFVLLAVPFLFEIAGPFVAERHRGGTPWHPHHVAERYGLMVLIALGEGMLGTMANLTAVVRDGIGLELGLLVFAGTALTFGLWWMYFVLPHGEMLSAWRRRSFAWGYGHIPLFGAIVAIGAGLDISGAYLEGEGGLTLLGAFLAVAIPLGVFLVLFYLLYSVFTLSVDPFHLVLLLGSALIVAAGTVLAGIGVGLSWDLALLALTPWVTVVGYETVGRRHNAALLQRTAAAASAPAG